MDWWARGIAAFGAIAGLISLGWQILKWWVEGRVNVKVMGSAGKVSMNRMGQSQLEKGERFGYEHVVVEVVNRSREPIWVHGVGFEERKSKKRWNLDALLGQLPKQLSWRQKEIVASNPEDLSNALARGVDVRPFCEDGEGKRHFGKNDKHFDRFRHGLRERGN